jgi:L-alanine-DL-glutamate epimerase-like enolase superfamily enzyme
VPWRADLLVPREQFVDGRLVVPHGPGYGIELNDTVVAEHS